MFLLKGNVAGKTIGLNFDINYYYCYNYHHHNNYSNGTGNKINFLMEGKRVSALCDFIFRVSLTSILREKNP
jgi:hypothetical protein